MRYLWLFLWILFLVLGLFYMRTRWHSLLIRADAVKQEAGGEGVPAADNDSPETFEDWILPVIRHWDFKQFQNRMPQDLRNQIPEKPLRLLFESVALKLGPFRFFDGPARRYFSKEPAEESVFESEAMFYNGRARLEVHYRDRGSGREMTEMALESPLLEDAATGTEHNFSS